MHKALKYGLGVGAISLALAAAPVITLVAMFGGDRGFEEDPAVADGVTRIRDGYVALFAVELGDGRVALIDAGNDPEGEAMTEGLQQLGKSLDDVAAVFLTHGHGDHIAGCHLLADAEIIALASERPLIEGEASANGPITQFFTNEPGCKVTRTVTDGERVQLGGVDFAVHAVPGHTAGSAAILARGVLFLGDAAGSDTAGGVTNAKWIFTDDTAQAGDSLVRLARTLDADEVDVLAFAHTGRLAGLQPLADFTP